MSSGIRVSFCLLLAGALGVCLSGCRRPARPSTARIAMPDCFSVTGTGSAPEKWWQAFGDDALNDLVDQALDQNLDLLAAWDRLAQAEAAAERVNANFWPRLDASAGAVRARADVSNIAFYDTDYSVGFGASYEVDLWSQLKSTRQAARLSAEARRSDLQTVAITISAAVADTWYQLAEAKALEKVAQQQIDTNNKVLTIVTTQFRKGMTSAADVLRQRQLVAATEAQQIAFEEAIVLLQNRLSILIGTAPAPAWGQTTIDFPAMPELPDPGLPTDVLLRRPDVLAAYQNVQVADHYLAVAIADQYPRLSISSRFDTSAPSVHDLFDDWTANLIANAFQPLFDAGARKAEVKRQQAIVSEAIHRWQQSILNALKEVEDALTREQQQRRILENLNYQLQLARQTFDRNRQRYIKGQIDYIRVLESVQSLQSLERNAIRDRLRVIQSRIALYRAIAGKWELPAPSEPDPAPETESDPEIEKPLNPEETTATAINSKPDFKEHRL